jgi:XTP/dITP diphosphohydrolase
MEAPADLAVGLAGAGDDAAGENDLGSRLFALVGEAVERGADPEAELRAVSRVFRERVQAWERRRQRA